MRRHCWPLVKYTKYVNRSERRLSFMEQPPNTIKTNIGGNICLAIIQLFSALAFTSSLFTVPWNRYAGWRWTILADHSDCTDCHISTAYICPSSDHASHHTLLNSQWKGVGTKVIPQRGSVEGGCCGSPTRSSNLWSTVTVNMKYSNRASS